MAYQLGDAKAYKIYRYMFFTRVANKHTKGQNKILNTTLYLPKAHTSPQKPVWASFALKNNFFIFRQLFFCKGDMIDLID